MWTGRYGDRQVSHAHPPQKLTKDQQIIGKRSSQSNR
jgi:hypothetical protein